jgi:hypothetical protein
MSLQHTSVVDTVKNITVNVAVPYLRRSFVSFPPQLPGSGHVGFVVDKGTRGQDFSEYFGAPPAKHSTDCSTLIINGTIGHLVASAIVNSVPLHLQKQTKTVNIWSEPNFCKSQESGSFPPPPHPNIS